ncbi:MAG: hypothetical protein HYV63_28710 [Candidatus Schekmanbacteria bacterium]|nr:hypothetical protein [Candidatus Schekmanbacteria bacterium]
MRETRASPRSSRDTETHRRSTLLANGIRPFAIGAAPLARHPPRVFELGAAGPVLQGQRYGID